MRGFVTALLAATSAVAIMAAPASAACKRYGFSVNDYGKDGPTRDAKDLLDKHIAKKMGELGVKTYQTGKKDVKCELYLNLIVFDEHTCTAEATVCWDGTALPAGQQAKSTDGSAAKPKEATGSIEKPKAEKPAADAKPAAAESVVKEAVPVTNEQPPAKEAGSAAVTEQSQPTAAAPAATTATPAATTDVAPVAPVDPK